MNTEMPLQFEDLQENRKVYIKALDSSADKTLFSANNADSMYSLGLTMYSLNYSFESVVYNAFASSSIDDSIALHPEQMNIIKAMTSNKGIVFSAPTSFGKTFTIFEYITRYKPNNVVLVVPTLALIDEYKQKVIKKYKTSFSQYKVYLSVEEDRNYDFDGYNLFILTHDRVVNESTVSLLERIDFLVIDEVYKLQKDEENDRTLILNLAYYNLVVKSIKYVLLAPFIKGIENLDMLAHTPTFYSTNFSPVVNEVKTVEIASENERNLYATRILDKIPANENTLIYFPTVVGIENFINDTANNGVVVDNPVLKSFVQWAREEIHEEWIILKALENGYLVHHGQLPLGIRLLELDLFNGDNSGYHKLICTSTLLEGVNTSAKNIIITKPARGYGLGNFDAFDFYNLVGRTGRLYQHYLGVAYYIKTPSDPIYLKDEALKKIEFELTQQTIDIDINCNDYTKHPIFLEFLNILNIDFNTYKTEVASKCRFNTVKFMYENYQENRNELLNELSNLLTNDAKSKLELIRVLYKIIEGQHDKFTTFIINRLTYMKRQSIKEVVNETKKFYSSQAINRIINTVIRLKSSYIEFDFYTKISIIKFFMICENINTSFINAIYEKLEKNIEYSYFINSPAKKMLKDMGVYDNDIDVIIRAIGTSFETLDELQSLLKVNINKLGNIGIVSRYVINNLINLSSFHSDSTLCNFLILNC